MRALKPRSVRSLAFLVARYAFQQIEAVRAVVEGAFVGDFDPDTYKSDRKDQRLNR